MDIPKNLCVEDEFLKSFQISKPGILIPILDIWRNIYQWSE